MAQQSCNDTRCIFFDCPERSMNPPNSITLTNLIVATMLMSIGMSTAVAQVPPANPFPEAVAVPAGILDGGTEWLNTEGPISLKELRGKVVLLDFWTYCCINCIHVLPDLKYLEEKYANELVVIGVHSAKFDNEKLSDNIRDAILRYEIKHPVVNDSEMTIWRRFGTRAWPTLALIDPEGKFIGKQGGEGNRELFDLIIGKVVAYHREKGTLDEDPIDFELEERSVEAGVLKYPGKILTDAASDRLFISDSNHNRIVITRLDGTHIATVGNGQIGRNDGAFSDATFDHPQGIALVDDTLYVADTENHLLRAIDLASKTVSTLAGTGRQGRPRDVNGNVKLTDLNSPWDLLHIDGTLYIAMAGPHQIWSHKLGTDEIKVHAGDAREDVINGSLASSAFAQPSGLAVNAEGTAFFVADSEGSSIRRVPTAPDGKVTTIAGTSELPRGQSLFAFGDVDAAGAEARFQHPLGVAVHDGAVYVADSYNHKIRRIDLKTNVVTTWLGTGEAGDALDPVQLSEPAGLSVSGGNLYIADTNNHRILKVDFATKQTSVIDLQGVDAPAKPKRRRVPRIEDADQLPPQNVAAADALQVEVRLNVPKGSKRNEDYPVVWQVFVVDGDQVVSPDVLNGREEAAVKEGIATFDIPLNQTEGTARIIVEVGYGYCNTEGSGLCRLASNTWAFPLTVSKSAENDRLSLSFAPAAKAESSEQSDE